MTLSTKRRVSMITKIRPGAYRATNTGPGCRWYRLSGWYEEGSYEKRPRERWRENA